MKATMVRSPDKLTDGWIRSKTVRLMEGLKRRWLGPVQTTIASGLENGKNPRAVGLQLAGRVDPETGLRSGGLIELDESEKATVRQFEKCILELDPAYFDFELRDRRYDRSMRPAIRDRRPLADEKRSLLVNRFEAKLLKAKADLIAQTEMLMAMNRSEWLSTKAAMERNGKPEAAMARIWDSCGDDKVRLSHKALDGQRVVGFQQPFVSPLTGAKMMYPGDRALGAPEDEVSGCRCRVRYDIDFTYGVRLVAGETDDVS